MKNRTALKHGMLNDFRQYLINNGWKIENPKGEYEVLRASRADKVGYLLVWNRTTGGCGYSIDERDIKIYQKYQADRRRRGLDPDFASIEEKANEPIIFKPSKRRKKKKRKRKNKAKFTQQAKND